MAEHDPVIASMVALEASENPHLPAQTVDNRPGNPELTDNSTTHRIGLMPETQLTFYSDGTHLQVMYLGEKYQGIITADYDSETSSYVLTVAAGDNYFSGPVAYESNNQVCTDLSELLDGKNIIASTEDILFHLETDKITNTKGE